MRNADHVELCMLALRLWLVEAYSRRRDDHARWQAGSGWPALSRFDQHGGFAALRSRPGTPTAPSARSTARR